MKFDPGNNTYDVELEPFEVIRPGTVFHCRVMVRTSSDQLSMVAEWVNTEVLPKFSFVPACGLRIEIALPVDPDWRENIKGPPL